MPETIIKFLMSKMGISVIAIALIFIVGGVQQLRINSYQSEVKELSRKNGTLSLTIELKKSEAIELTKALTKQNDLVEGLQTTAAEDKERRESNLLKLKFKHEQALKKLNQGKGPEDLNKWLKNSLN